MKSLVLRLGRAAVLAALPLTLAAQTPAAVSAEPAPASVETPAQRDARMAWWREARFGMFVHWGLYSGLAGSWNGKKAMDSGGAEWIQQHVGADTDTYAAAAKPLFRPKAGFATEWAKLARQAGCSYVVFTTKHHEGFALHDSKLSDYDAGDLLQRDLVREIVEALRAEGLKVGFYHSVIDWHHPDYDFTRAKQLPYPSGGRKVATGPRDHSRYIDFLHGQVRELVSNYGPVDILWWDYSSQDFQGDAAWRAFPLMALVREKQPGIIMNNRLFRVPEAGFSGMGTHNVTARMDPRYGDFVTPEQHIPETGLPGVDWETCMTLNTTWGYNQHDLKWKTSEQLIRNLVDIASKGGNYLLNIGPKADGSVPRETLDSMRDIGKWMAVNAESIRGTTASPMGKVPFGRVTHKARANGGTLYLHVFDWPAGGKLALPGLRNPVTGARLLAGGAPVSFSAADGETILSLPAASPDAVAAVIAVEYAGSLDIVRNIPRGNAKKGVVLPARAATFHNPAPNGARMEGDNIGYWMDARSTVDWLFEMADAGEYEIALEYACLVPQDLQVEAGGKTLPVHLPATGDYKKFTTSPAVRVTLKPGEHKLGLVPVAQGWQAVNVKTVTLTPAK